jgi:hypothetical protein
MDVPVIISGENEIVFLTKEGILRRNSEIKPCSNNYEFFHIQITQIVRKDNLITTIKKDEMKINFFDATGKNGLSKVKKYLKNFLEFSRKYFGTNEDFLIFRDFTLLILLLIVVIMV